MAKIEVQGKEITVISTEQEDYISLTDMIRDMENGFALIEKWLRNKNTIEFLGIWEEIYNPDFNSPEFEGIKNQAGLNRFVLSVKQWSLKKGNIRDYADVFQLVCLANLENLNALFIHERLSQENRLERLNRIAIQQMQLLMKDAGMKRFGKVKIDG